MSDKIYIWNGKQSKYGVNLSFSRKDLETMQANLNEKGYINLNLNERKEIGKYGETHSMTVNTWKSQSQGISQSEAQSVFSDSKVNVWDIPF